QPPSLLRGWDPLLLGRAAGQAGAADLLLHAASPVPPDGVARRTPVESRLHHPGAQRAQGQDLTAKDPADRPSGAGADGPEGMPVLSIFPHCPRLLLTWNIAMKRSHVSTWRYPANSRSPARRRITRSRSRGYLASKSVSIPTAI